MAKAALNGSVTARDVANARGSPGLPGVTARCLLKRNLALLTS